MNCHISAKIYTDLLVETRKIGWRSLSTPMGLNYKLCMTEEESSVDKRMYQRLVRKYIYLAYMANHCSFSK